MKPKREFLGSEWPEPGMGDDWLHSTGFGPIPQFGDDPVPDGKWLKPLLVVVAIVMLILILVLS